MGRQCLIILRRCRLPQFVCAGRQLVVQHRNDAVIAGNQIFISLHGNQVDRGDVAYCFLSMQRKMSAGQRLTRIRVRLQNFQREGSVFNGQNRE